MDDFIAALLCLPFIILPAIVLVVIVANKVKASLMSKEMCVALPGFIHWLASLWLKEPCRKQRAIGKKDSFSCSGGL